MDGSSQLAAAKKLADWFGIAETKTAPHMAKPSNKPEMQKATSEPSTSGDSVKYMASIDAWYDELVKRSDQESDEDYRKRILKAIKQKLLESFRSGKAQR